MGELTVDEAQLERLLDASQMLEKAFPAFSCLRCGHEQFLLRLVLGVSATSGQGEADLIEATCKRCGLVEQHRLNLLRDALLATKLPLPSDG